MTIKDTGRPRGTSSTKSRYAAHHEAHGRYGFSFGADSRGSAFRAWLDGAERVLDAGCRDGTLATRYLAGHRAIGCDIDEQALRRCQLGPRFPVVNCDITEGLPFRAGSFDAAVLGEVLEHLPDPLYALGEIHRVLRPGAVFVGSVPNAYRLKNRLRFLAGATVDPDPTHLQLFSPDALTSVLERTGFEDVRLRFLESRFLRLSPTLFGNTMLWRARKRPTD